MFLCLALLITSGCSIKTEENKRYEVEPETVYITEPKLEPDTETEYIPKPETKPSPETAYIHASIPNFNINKIPLEENLTIAINSGKHTLTYKGVIERRVKTEPIIKAEKEQANAAKFTACISALPFCPVTLLLMQIAFDDESIIKYKCSGKLEFYALNEVSYYVQLQTFEHTEPKIIVSGAYNQTVAETTTECDASNTSEKDRN